jgi:uncharacterized protein YukE
VSINLPPELVFAIGLVGLPWPDVDEDQLRSYANHLREYASSLQDTHSASHARIGALAAGNSGPAYEALVERWAHVSSSHMSELVDTCHALATALDVAAGAVEVAKDAIIVALAAMAAAFVADQAAAVATLGLAEAATLAIIETGKIAVKAALDQLEQIAIAEALQAAIGPLEEKLAAAVQGMVLHAVEGALA